MNNIKSDVKSRLSPGSLIDKILKVNRVQIKKSLHFDFEQRLKVKTTLADDLRTFDHTVSPFVMRTWEEHASRLCYAEATRLNTGQQDCDNQLCGANCLTSRQHWVITSQLYNINAAFHKRMVRMFTKFEVEIVYRVKLKWKSQCNC